MNATELEKKYLERVSRSGSLLLLPASDAVELLDDLARANARFLGAESFRRDLRSGWKSDPDALSRTKNLIQEGKASGYDWFEVSVDDPDTAELLFFRAFEK